MIETQDSGKSLDLGGVMPQKPLQEAVKGSKVALHIKRQGKGDVFTFSTDEHRVGLSLRNVVIEHHHSCGFKGSPLDKRKTFHHWLSFLVYVDKCKLHIDQQVIDKLEADYKAMRKLVTY